MKVYFLLLEVLPCVVCFYSDITDNNLSLLIDLSVLRTSTSQSDFQYVNTLYIKYLYFDNFYVYQYFWWGWGARIYFVPLIFPRINMYV